MFLSDNANGINAMYAHEARTKDDNTFVRGIVESYTFLGFGLVVTYLNEKLTVKCGNTTYTNVEVVVLGVDGWGIKPVPAPNDRVLLFSTQVPVGDVKQFTASGSMPAYDPSGLKAIPITDSTSAQLITVSKTGIEITGANKLKVNAQGVQFQDVNNNKVTTSATGVAFEDKNGNKMTTASAGITVEDKNGCKIETSSSSVKINGKLEIKK